MTITLKHEKSTKGYEKYVSNDHNSIWNVYLPKEEFAHAPVPRTISIEVPIAEAPAAKSPSVK